MTPCNVLPFPATRPAVTHRTVHLLNLNGDVVFSAGFPSDSRDPGAPWAWICETVSAELSVSEESVGCAEGDDGEDFVTVEGIRVYQVEIARRCN